jgi:hypothetical protein
MNDPVDAMNDAIDAVLRDTVASNVASNEANGAADAMAGVIDALCEAVAGFEDFIEGNDAPMARARPLRSPAARLLRRLFGVERRLARATS